jgi:hypothetical protein
MLLRIVKLIVGLAVSFTLSWLWVLILTPIHVNIKRPSDVGVVLTVNGRQRTLVHYPVAANHHVSVKNISQSGGVIELALPIPDNQPRLTPDAIKQLGPWTSMFAGERLTSQVPNAELTFDLNAAVPELPFLQRPDGGVVLVTIDGAQQTYDLRNPLYDWHPLRFPASYFTSVATLNSLGDNVLEFVAFGKSSTEGTILWGASRTIRRVSLSPGQRLNVTIPLVDKCTLAFRGTFDLWMIFFEGCLLAGIFSLFGVMIASLVSMPTASWLSYFSIGISLFALLANTLAYVFGSQDLKLIYQAFLLGCAGVGLFLVCKRRDAPLASERMPLLAWTAIALSVWLTFWPMASVGVGFLGYLQTDSFFYTTVSEALRTKALGETIASGGIIGFGLRSIDLVLASVLSSITGFATPRTWIVLCITFLCIPPIASYHMVMAWLKDRRVALWTCIAVAFSAPISGLFFESYWAQYLLTAVLFLNLYTGALLSNAVASRSGLFKSLIPFALTSTFAFLLYPYFAAVPFVAVVVLLWQLRNDLVHAGRFCASLILQVLVLGNIGFVFLANGKAMQFYVAHLNGLAKNIVFPFYDEPRFTSFILGLVPFHRNLEVIEAMARDSMQAWYLISLSPNLTLTELGVDAILLIVGICYVGAFIAYRSVLFQPTGRMLFLTLGAYFFLMLFAWNYSGLYGFCKLCWTFATLLPVIVGPILAFAAVKGSGVEYYALKGVSIVVLSFYVIANFASKATEPLYWLASPSSVAKQANTGVAGDLFLLSAWLEAHTSPGRTYTFVSQTSDRLARQRDQVFAAQAYALMAGNGFVCLNCISTADLLDFGHFDTPSSVADADIQVIVGGRSPQEIYAGWNVVVDGERLRILVRDG